MALTEAEELELLELEAQEAQGAQKAVAPAKSAGGRYDYDYANPSADIINALRLFTNSASGGLSEKAGAGLSALGVKQADVTGVAPEGEIGDLGEEYQGFLDKQSGSLEDFKKRHPFVAGGAEIGGLVTPGGMFSTAMKGASKVPFIAKLLNNPKLIAQLTGAGLRGGIANATYGQSELALDPDTEVSDIPIEAAKDFGVGATLDAGTTGVIKGARAVSGFPKFLFRGAKKAAGAVADKMSGGYLSARAAEKFGNKVDDFARATGTADTAVAGREASEGIGQIKGDVLKDYGAMTKDVLSQHGEKAVSAETLRKGIMRELESIGAVDAKGNVIDDALIAKFDPELKTVVQRLSTFSDELVNNPSLADLDRITKGIGKLAKFNSGNRGVREEIFGALFKDARTSFLEGIDDAVSKAGGEGAATSEAIRAARQNVSKNLGVSEGPLGKLADKAPEEVISKARGTGKMTLGSQVDEAMSADPRYREPMRKIVIGDIVRSASDQKALKKALEAYKDVLPKLMDKTELAQLRKLAGIQEKSAFAKGRGFLLDKLAGPTSNPGAIETAPRAVAPWLEMIMGKSPRVLSAKKKTDDETRMVAR